MPAIKKGQGIVMEKKYRILIVDDSPIIMMELTDILSSDYEVYTEIDAQKAVETAEKLLPDIILLDIIMPEQDGYTVVASLKNHEKTKDIPVIFISGLSTIDNEARGLLWGAVDYIRKPFEREIIKLRVENQIKILEQIEEIEAANSVCFDLTKLLTCIIDDVRGPISSITKVASAALGEDIDSKAKDYFREILSDTDKLISITDNAIKKNLDS